ncbi:YFH1 [Candida pseudojiufengensis]|uniref:YFH1 n=1 Tax=Candida pseudojiufengensis TaxID=497109 RepID=UPI00222565F2|nr:YFH1 [Candida pseudojiufengensis]KAI5965840.1 YFH1 [Candida pseudojiufengensis]
MFRSLIKVSSFRSSKHLINSKSIKNFSHTFQIFNYNLIYRKNINHENLSKNISKRFYSVSTQGENLEGKIDKISDLEYNNISNEYLDNLAESLEDLNEEYEQVDAELSHGVLTLHLPPHGTYVINKQPPNKQIWLSSPVSGPKRYDLIEGKWITLRDGTALTDLLENEISSALNIEYKFKDLNN